MLHCEEMITLTDETYELGILDAGNHAQCSAAALTGLDVDAEGALEALHPAQRVVLRGMRLRAAAAACRVIAARRRLCGAKRP